MKTGIKWSEWVTDANDLPRDKGLLIRLARPEDVSRIRDFNQAMARETEGKSLEDRVISQGVQRIFEEPIHGFYVVAENQGHIIGTLMVTREWSDWRNGQFWWIQSVYVVREFRRRGVYREMYQFVRERASSSQEVCGFRLYVEKDNEVAQKTYRSLGMMETPYLMYEEELLRPA